MFVSKFREIFLDPLRNKHHFGRYKIVKNLIRECGKQILDIGCGSPAQCVPPGSFLRELGYGSGIDVVWQDIEFDFAIGDFRQIPFKDAQFDCVTAIEVIEHLDNADDALREVYRVLKQDCVFVVTTPNNNLLFTLLWWTWEHTFGVEWKHKHLITFNKKEWIELFTKSSLFRVEECIDYWGINLIVKLRKL